MSTFPSTISTTNIGCDCLNHGCEWISCTEPHCTFIYCRRFVNLKHGIDNLEWKYLLDSPTMFKCIIHGFNNIFGDYSEEQTNINVQKQYSLEELFTTRKPIIIDKNILDSRTRPANHHIIYNLRWTHSGEYQFCIEIDDQGTLIHFWQLK
eukprot:502548_1